MKVTYLEDFPVVREGLEFLLTHKAGIEIYSIADLDESNILSQLSRTAVDCIILDLYFNKSENQVKKENFDLCKKIKEAFPQTKILAYSMYDNFGQINKAFRFGADGFVSKRAGFDELVKNLFLLQTSHRVLCSYSKQAVANAENFCSGKENILKGKNQLFTKSEKLILEQITKGYSNREIAAKLFLSEKTIEAHRRNLFLKAQVKNVSELVAFAYSRGILV